MKQSADIPQSACIMVWDLERLVPFHALREPIAASEVSTPRIEQRHEEGWQEVMAWRTVVTVMEAWSASGQSPSNGLDATRDGCCVIISARFVSSFCPLMPCPQRGDLLQAWREDGDGFYRRDWAVVPAKPPGGQGIGCRERPGTAGRGGGSSAAVVASAAVRKRAVSCPH